MLPEEEEVEQSQQDALEEESTSSPSSRHVSFKLLVMIVAFAWVIVTLSILFPVLIAQGTKNIERRVDAAAHELAFLTRDRLEAFVNESYIGIFNLRNIIQQTGVPDTSQPVRRRLLNAMTTTAFRLYPYYGSIFVRFKDGSALIGTCVSHNGTMQVYSSPIAFWSGALIRDTRTNLDVFRTNMTSLDLIDLGDPIVTTSFTFVNGPLWNVTQGVANSIKTDGPRVLKAPSFTGMYFDGKFIATLNYMTITSAYMDPLTKLDPLAMVLMSSQMSRGIGVTLRSTALLGGENARAFLVDDNGYVIELSHGLPFKTLFVKDDPFNGGPLPQGCFLEPGFRERIGCLYNVSSHPPYALLKIVNSFWPMSKSYSGHSALDRVIEDANGNEYYAHVVGLRADYAMAKVITQKVYLFTPTAFFLENVATARNVSIAVSCTLVVVFLATFYVVLSLVTRSLEDLSERMMKNPWETAAIHRHHHHHHHHSSKNAADADNKNNNNAASAASNKKRSTSSSNKYNKEKTSPSSSSLSPKKDGGAEETNDHDHDDHDDNTNATKKCPCIYCCAVDSSSFLDLEELVNLEDVFSELGDLVAQIKGFMAPAQMPRRALRLLMDSKRLSSVSQHDSDGLPLSLSTSSISKIASTDDSSESQVAAPTKTQTEEEGVTKQKPKKKKKSVSLNLDTSVHTLSVSLETPAVGSGDVDQQQEDEQQPGDEPHRHHRHPRRHVSFASQQPRGGTPPSSSDVVVAATAAPAATGEQQQQKKNSSPRQKVILSSPRAVVPPPLKHSNVAALQRHCCCFVEFPRAKQALEKLMSLPHHPSSPLPASPSPTQSKKSSPGFGSDVDVGGDGNWVTVNDPLRGGDPTVVSVGTVAMRLMRETSRFVETSILGSGAALVEFYGDGALCCFRVALRTHSYSRILTHFVMSVMHGSEVLDVATRDLVGFIEEEEAKSSSSSTASLTAAAPRGGGGVVVSSSSSSSIPNSKAADSNDSNDNNSTSQQQRRSSHHQHSDPQNSSSTSLNGGSGVSSVAVSCGISLGMVRVLQVSGAETHLARPVTFVGSAVTDAYKLALISRFTSSDDASSSSTAGHGSGEGGVVGGRKNSMGGAGGSSSPVLQVSPVGPLPLIDDRWSPARLPHRLLTTRDVTTHLTKSSDREVTLSRVSTRYVPGRLLISKAHGESAALRQFQDLGRSVAEIQSKRQHLQHHHDTVYRILQLNPVGGELNNSVSGPLPR